jgi:crotonobetainyl-CoA:carnitine CoA-transferase CaiB-like acyl-CoA transferase
MPFAPASSALRHIRVLDLTRARSGPTCVRHLADWGADVIKIEMAGDEDAVGDRDGPDFQNLHRNKRSMTINLKDPAGLEVFKRLVKSADVIVENYRPDVKFRLKIDYESMNAVNGRIIYGSISGFGQDGPYKDRPGFDQIAQGMGGLMSVTGLPGQGPVRVGVPIADLSAGMFLAMGILVALVERESSGQGQRVDTSLLQAQIAMLDFQAARWLMRKEVPEQAGNDHPTLIPTGVFPTHDGYINLQAAGAAIFSRLCRALGLEKLQTDPRFANVKLRSENRAALHEAISTVTSTRSSEDWIEILNAAGVPCGPIYRIDEMFADPQVRHLCMSEAVSSPKLGKIELVAQAIGMSRTPSRILAAAPERGEHTDEVLREIGYDREEIAELRMRNAV